MSISDKKTRKKFKGAISKGKSSSKKVREKVRKAVHHKYQKH